MSSLTEVEKRYLEKLLGMGGGYVLDFVDDNFEAFFKGHGIDNIHGPKYQTSGTSKAKKLRSFWEQEDDELVGKVLSEMLDVYCADCDLKKRNIDRSLLKKGRNIVDRLLGRKSSPNVPAAEDNFLDRDFSFSDIDKLPIDPAIVPIIEDRLKEAQRALQANANLSVIFLCGSVLEAVLLGAAQKEPDRFKKATASLKKGDFRKWTLAQLIDVSCEVGLLKEDVKKYSHGLREFRNYIHPYQQLESGFSPDQRTAKLCFDVLIAALADLAGKR